VGENTGLLRHAIRRRNSLGLVLLSAALAMLLVTPSASANPPEINVTIYGTLGANGWYRSNVTVNWTVIGAQISTGCDAKTISADTTGTKITCTASSGGDETTKSVTIKRDMTAPSAAPIPVRPPDANGWYNRPLAVSFAGADETSGLEGCSSAQYAGPDNVAAAVVGSCRDNAGNVTGTGFSFRYDATAPTIFGITAKRGNRSAELTWRKSTDTMLVAVVRAPGRDGAGETVIHTGADAGYRDAGLVVGRKYEYRVVGVDEAANRSEQKVDFIATGALLSPAPAESVKAPPELTWTPVKGASYYNVQLIRGEKVFSAWPARTVLRLRRTWIHDGRRHRLRPGVYRWYVWPGYGRIKAARYGKLLGSSTFVVTG
jgi:hypothetical protein